MQKDEIQQITSEIRQELDYQRGVSPHIVEVFEHSDDSLHVILPDRAEKSLMIGPGGRIVAELSKRTGKKVTYYGEDELILRRYRLRLTVSRITEIIDDSSPPQQEFLAFLRDRVEQEIEYPKVRAENQKHKGYATRIQVAFSGGVDSGATLLIAKEHFENTKALIVNLGARFIDPRELGRIKDFCSKINVDFKVLSAPTEGVASLEAENHPCGNCHSRTMSLVRREAKDSGADVLLTGEMLPTGRQSIEIDKGMLVTHLPAALAMSKYLTKKYYARKAEPKDANRFGCHFLAQRHRDGWRQCGPSIYRVLRELQGDVLTTGEALVLIKSILIPAFRTLKHS